MSRYAGEEKIERQRKDLNPAGTVRDAKSVERVITVVESVINPFSFDGPELVNIYSSVVASSSSQKDIISAMKLEKLHSEIL